MAKLYYRYGVVSSAKTMNLLAVAHNYQVQGKRVLLIKPRVDDRYGEEKIRSRTGLESNADILVDEESNLDPRSFQEVNCVLVDEAQFIAPRVIDQLRDIASTKDIPVICYGLRADFRSELFPGSKRLLELADTIEEIKTTCYYCNKKAIMNLKHTNGIPSLDGPSVQLGAEERYFPTCYRCYQEQLRRHAR